LEDKVCPRCEGLGWVKVKNGVQRCECRYKHITDTIYNRMNIPKRYRDKDFSNLVKGETVGHPIIMERVEDYINSSKYTQGKGLFIVGPPGVGKTHLAVGILKEFFKRRGVVGLFYDTRTLLFNLKSSFDGSASAREILEDVVNAPILVLDDLGSERLSDWARDILHYIIISRYNDLKPIIITSNIDLKARNTSVNALEETLEERMGQSIASRLSEMCEIIPVKGEDKRGTNLVKTEVANAKG